MPTKERGAKSNNATLKYRSGNYPKEKMKKTRAVGHSSQQVLEMIGGQRPIPSIKDQDYDYLSTYSYLQAENKSQSHRQPNPIKKDTNDALK
jgi:outer membrane protein assembly factor BamE (lipoprotein component of BamABCDE complex)